MKQFSIGLAEGALLFAALFFTLPYVPSHPMERLPLFPGAAFAVTLFAASRIVRWRKLHPAVFAESAAFSLFAYGSNAVSNLLYSL